ncbi:MAG: hypothetical protein KKH98_13750 [Spirochaetes bacterium]|nr:hypothetical protein [Spirochaetota bacterium]
MVKISKKERAELIRKGNRLFNDGKIEKASRIFETVQYIDGLIRVGDHYYAKKELVNSLIYYKKANYQKRIEQLAPEIASICKAWIAEGE